MPKIDYFVCCIKGTVDPTAKPANRCWVKKKIPEPSVDFVDISEKGLRCFYISSAEIIDSPYRSTGPIINRTPTIYIGTRQPVESVVQILGKEVVDTLKSNDVDSVCIGPDRAITPMIEDGYGTFTLEEYLMQQLQPEDPTIVAIDKIISKIQERITIYKSASAALGGSITEEYTASGIDQKVKGLTDSKEIAEDEKETYLEAKYNSRGKIKAL